MDIKDLGRVADGDQALVNQAPAGLGPSGFDPSRKLFFSRSEVCGVFAMWAVRQSPYTVPDKLEAAIVAVKEALPDDASGWFWATEVELRELVYDICLERVPQIMAWNVPKSGHNANFVFSSRYDQPDPDDDIIDLYALSGNICRTLLNEQYDASAIETGTAETEGLGPKAESAARQGDAQSTPGTSHECAASLRARALSTVSRGEVIE